MSAPKLTPQLVAARIERIREQLGNAILKSENPRLIQLWEHWDSELVKIFTEADKRPEVAIALLGGTGSGKSTLVNALIGSRLLPTAENRACTSTVTEVAYKEGGDFEVVVRFLTQSEWLKERSVLLEDLRDSDVGNDPEAPAQDRVWLADLRRAARDRLMAVYGIADPSQVRVEDLRRMAEPPEINKYFEMRIGRFKTDNPGHLKKLLAQFLDSHQRYWPIVKSVRVSGPFAALESGATLIDLPGLNDPNEAREAVAKSRLKQARYVWVVYNVKRALTGEIVNLMRSEDFHRNLILDGRVGALSFVGSASDGIDTDNARQELRLSDEHGDAEVILENNAAVERQVRRQLEDLIQDYQGLAGGQIDGFRHAAERLRGSRVFAVSAREFIRLAGLSKSRPMGLETLEQTGIPGLRAHLNELCSGHGVQAALAEQIRQVDTICRRVEQEIRAQILHRSKQVEIDQEKRREMEAALKQAHTFLSQEAEHLRKRAREEIEAAQSILDERLSRAVERGRANLNHTLDLISPMHWNSHRAMMRRKGRYNRLDLSADIAKPVLDAIAFAWSDYFGDRLNRILDRTTDDMVKAAGDQRRSVLAALTEAGLGSAQTEADLRRLFETTEKVLAEQTAQASREMREKIEEARQNLHQVIPNQVRSNMEPAYQEAARVTGTGTKARILELVDTRAREVSEVMFNDMRSVLMVRVRELGDSLNRKFSEMALTVLRHASLAMEGVQGLAARQATPSGADDRPELQRIQTVVAGILDDQTRAA